MKKKFLILTISVLSSCYLFSQTFLNGGFELNNTEIDLINLTNEFFDSYMDSTTAFGAEGNLDILTSNSYCDSSAVEGNWYVALTGGGSDAFSMKLDNPLIVGNSYTISFFDRFCIPYDDWVGDNSLVEIGLSLIDGEFGNSIYTTTSLPTSAWALRTFSFIAPVSGQYITVKLNSGGTLTTWLQVDGFSFNTGTIGINDTKAGNFENIIYPNPTKDFLFLNEPYKISSLKIYDHSGLLLLSNDHLNKDNAPQRIDLKGFQNGLYIVHLTTKDNNSITRRLIFDGE
jgi:hypothetical protein